MMRDYCEAARNDSAVLSATAFTKIADVNHKRSYFYVYSIEGKACINLRPTGSAVMGTGVQLKTGSNPWIMPTDTLYTGEICACGVDGTATISILEY
jgi:hypothetical protein